MRPILLLLTLAGCSYQGRGTTQLCESCSQTSDCSEGLFCGPAGQCTTTDCDVVGCGQAVGFSLTCVDKVCACSVALDMAVPDFSIDLGVDMAEPLDLRPSG